MDKENSIFLSGLNGVVGSEIHKKKGLAVRFCLWQQ